jgi:hypothetical protein
MTTSFPEEGVKVTRLGGYTEAGPASTFSSAEIESKIAEQIRIVRVAEEEVEKAKKEAEVHAALEVEATKLREDNMKQSAEMAMYVKKLEQEVELAKAKEVNFEHQRALAHKEAVSKEDERVRAKTTEILRREEAKEAERLELHHKAGRLYALKKAQQHEIEVQEANLKIQSFRLQTDYPEVRASSGQAAKIEVLVTPREIPESRVFDYAAPTAKTASGSIEEQAPVIEASSKSAVEIVQEQATMSETKVQTETSGVGMKKKKKVRSSSKEEQRRKSVEQSTQSAQAPRVSSLPEEAAESIPIVGTAKIMSETEAATLVSPAPGDATIRKSAIMEPSGVLPPSAAPGGEEIHSVEGASGTAGFGEFAEEKKKKKSGGFFSRFSKSSETSTAK